MSLNDELRIEKLKKLEELLQDHRSTLSNGLQNKLDDLDSEYSNL